MSVPVTSVIVESQPDGTGRIDPEKMTAKAIEMASSPDVKWIPEDSDIQPHPLQRPKEPGE